MNEPTNKVTPLSKAERKKTLSYKAKLFAAAWIIGIFIVGSGYYVYTQKHVIGWTLNPIIVSNAV